MEEIDERMIRVDNKKFSLDDLVANTNNLIRMPDDSDYNVLIMVHPSMIISDDVEKKLRVLPGEDKFYFYTDNEGNHLFNVVVSEYCDPCDVKVVVSTPDVYGADANPDGEKVYKITINE